MAGVQRTSTMRSLLLFGTLVASAHALKPRAALAQPAPEKLKTYKPVKKIASGRYRFEISFPCACKASGKVREMEWFRGGEDSDDDEAVIERVWEKVVKNHGECGILDLPSAAAADAPPTSPPAKRTRSAKKCPTPKEFRKGNQDMPLDDDDDDDDPPARWTSPRLPSVSGEVKYEPVEEIRDQSATADRLREARRAQAAASTGDDCNDCDGCAKKDRKILELLLECERPGAGWATAVEDLPPRTKGKATAGLVALERCQSDAVKDSDGSDTDDSDSDSDAGPRRSTDSQESQPASDRYQTPKAMEHAVRRGCKSAEQGLWAAGGGDLKVTEGVLMKVTSRFGGLLGIQDLKDILSLRAMGDAIRGFFKLAALPKGGTRQTHAQQKFDAVLEAVTPGDAKERGLLRGIARICTGKIGDLNRWVFAKAADRRAAQDAEGKLAPHSERSIRKDRVDVQCARTFWHDCEDVRLDTFAGRSAKTVKFLCLEDDGEGKRRLVLKVEEHDRHTKHAGDREIYDQFTKSAAYAKHLEEHPSHTIGFSLFVRAKCPCIGEPSQRECADEKKVAMREALKAFGRLRMRCTKARETCGGVVCTALRAAAAARTADPDAAVGSLPEEQDPAYRFSQIHTRANWSTHMFSAAMLCPARRHEDLELTDDDAERVMMYDKSCAYGDCEDCGVDERFFECPCEYTDEVKVTQRKYVLLPRVVKGPGANDGDDDVEETKLFKDLDDVEVTGKELIDYIRETATEYFTHVWNCRWANTARLNDLHKFGDNTIFIQSDYAAQLENSAQDNLTCTYRNHTNLDVFVVAHSPKHVQVQRRGRDGRLQYDDEGRPVQYTKRVTTNDAWKFYLEASGKGKDADYFVHHAALANLVDFYVEQRAKAGLPPLKKVILWTDGCPGQYMCCQNFVKVASFWKDRGLELVHRFALFRRLRRRLGVPTTTRPRDKRRRRRATSRASTTRSARRTGAGSRTTSAATRSRCPGPTTSSRRCVTGDRSR